MNGIKFFSDKIDELRRRGDYCKYQFIELPKDKYRKIELFVESNMLNHDLKEGLETNLLLKELGVILKCKYNGFIFLIKLI